MQIILIYPIKINLDGLLTNLSKLTYQVLQLIFIYKVVVIQMGMVGLEIQILRPLKVIQTTYTFEKSRKQIKFIIKGSLAKI